jgi:hypothetical protein
MVNACLDLTSGKRREDGTARKPRQFNYLTQGGNQMSDVAADEPGIQLFVSEHAGVWARFKRLFADPNYRLAAAVLRHTVHIFRRRSDAVFSGGDETGRSGQRGGRARVKE